MTTQRHPEGRRPRGDEPEIRVTQPEAKKCYQPPPKAGRAKEASFPRDFRGSMALLTPCF